uniref:Phosphodiesterase n=1 Tax=Phallusia mammillata TaxID=59560 RepID=A0A6F9DP22_9ASCI|nr:cAMP and cAMP-inhibited cGMP 3',5'-cyclic phosphodiesterase 10A [Phallusia mammillata]
MFFVAPQLLVGLLNYIRRRLEESSGRSLQWTESSIELCQCTTLSQLSEICRNYFSQCFCANAIHCFEFNWKNPQRFTDRSNRNEVHSDVLGSWVNKPLWKKVTVSEDDELSICIGGQQDVTFITVNGLGPFCNSALLFVVCQAGCEPNSSALTVFLQHASACYTRILQQSPDASQNNQTAVMLSDDLINATDANDMQIMLNTHLRDQTSSEDCCILLVSQEMNQIMCQVVGKHILDFEMCYPVNNGLFGKICEKGQWIIPSEKEMSDLEALFSTPVQSALCIPVRDKMSGKTIGIVCLCNKTGSQGYTATDVVAVDAVMSRSWTVLSSSLTLQKEKKARSECEAMLLIARKLFSRLDDVSMLLGEIIQEARCLTNAERCSVFLVDNEAQELVAKVFDGIVTMDESLDPKQYDFENMNEVRIPLEQGIAGQVAVTGKTLNISDAYAHPLFYRGIDNATGFRTRNILCFPIKDHNGVVVGVSQLCNKIKGSCFTSYDEELAEKFAVFSGISISHSLLYKEVEESHCRSRLANELMTYHMKVDKEDVKKSIPRSSLTMANFHPDFDKFVYPPRLLENNLKIKACIWMYEDLGLISKFHIPMRTLVHFMLMVRKGYRDPPYHNFDHAFSVMHHAYLIAKNLQLNSKLSDLEVIALLTASICHDLDHRGTNNAFQVNSHSVLASLYSSEGSVLERHHFAQAMCILNTSGCNIFENMSRKEYVRTLDLVKHIILATDVASHLQILPQLEKIVEEGMDLTNTCQRELLLALCMTACDLSDQTKQWETTKNTAKLIYKEFFSQGDMEKRMGNNPEIIHDRERACVPQLQINFMLHIAQPVYRILAALFPVYGEVYQRVQLNIGRWRRVEKEFKSRGLPNTDSLDFLTDEFDRDLFEDLE